MSLKIKMTLINFIILSFLATSLISCGQMSKTNLRQTSSEHSITSACTNLLETADISPEDIYCSENSKWENFGKTVKNYAPVFIQPITEEQISKIMKAAYRLNWKVRPVGSGHSWSQITQSDHILMGTHKLTQSLIINKETKTFTATAGIRLRDLVDYLQSQGYGVLNLGSSQSQTLAGAVSTNTHGTGISKTGFAGMVEAIRIVDGTGKIRVASKVENTDLFHSALSGIGLVGIITELTMRMKPDYNVTMQINHQKIEKLFNSNNPWHDLLEENEWFAMFWPIHLKKITTLIGNKATQEEIDGRLIKRSTTRKGGIRHKKIKVGGIKTKNKTVSKFKRNFVMKNSVNLLSDHRKVLAPLFPIVYNIYSTLKPSRKSTYHYADALSSDIDIQHWGWNLETEFFFPIEFLPKFIDEMKVYQKKIKKNGVKLAAPFLGIRFVKGDQSFLSQAYSHKGYDKFVTVNIYDSNHKARSTQWFRDVLEIIDRVVGDKELVRMHLGKIYLDPAKDFSERFYHWEKFNQQRQQSDPANLFINNWTQDFFH